MNTKEKSLDAMYRFVASHGYEKTSIRMIAEALGIKKASVYYYFKSKEELFLTMIDEYVYVNNEQFFLDYQVSKEEYRDVLYKIGYGFIDNFNANPKLVDVLMEFYTQSKRIESVEEKMKLYLEKDNQEIESVIRYGITIGVLKSDIDIKKVTNNVNIVLNGIIFSLAFGPDNDYKMIWKELIDKLFEKGAIDKP